MAAETADESPQPAALDLTAALKDAGIAALVSLVLAIPMFGFRIVGLGGGQGLGLDQRWDWVAMAIGAVFVGRLLLNITLQYRSDIAVAAADIGGSLSGLGRLLGPFLAAALFIVALTWPMLPFVDRYLLDLAVLVLTYVMLGWGLNIVVGLAGLLDLGYVAFYAVGAYSYALLATHFGLGFWECLPLAGAFAACFGILLGFPVLRLRGDYLAIVTLGFGEIIRIILLNWYTVTNGPDGISGIPRPTLFGIPFTAAPDEGVTAFHQFFGIEYASTQRIAFLY
jgi:branched-chain amino acid transport system permease protein